MPQYTVQKGDTLSAIAKKYGVSVNALGYSGDPRKLAIGTVLNFGGSAPAQPSSSGGSAPAPASPPDPLDSYLADARAQLNPGFQDVLDTTKQAGEIKAQNFSDLATQTLNREPLVRQTYANLAAELDLSKATEEKTAQQIGEQNIGEAKAALAGAGVENAQGSFRAPVTAQENKLAGDISSIEANYGLKQGTLTQQLNADVSQIEDQAAQYKMQGNQALADTLTELAKLKSDHDSAIQQLARQEFQAATQAEKEAFNEQLQLMKMDQEAQRTNLMIARLGQTESNAQTRAEAAIVSANKTASRDILGKATSYLNSPSLSNPWATAFNYAKQALGQQGLLSDDPKQANAQVDSFLGVPDDWIQSGKPGYQWFYSQK